MSDPSRTTLEETQPRVVDSPVLRLEPPSTRMDDLAYAAPMFAWLALTWAGGFDGLFAASYVLKTFLTAALLVLFWQRYTRIRWDYWWLGIIVGVIGIVQWVGMEKLLMAWWPNYPRIPGAADVFNPTTAFTSAWMMWAFILIRWAGAALVVPLMEELFWRDWLWRTVIAPNDFRLARVGEWDKVAFFGVAIAFATVHPQWITALTWGLMIGALLLYTKSLGACIIAHGVTNFLLGCWVQYSHEWFWW